ncbi:hypothetical protein [Pseudoalteromonas sp. MelDa3]|uniref:hypothetical protein n=1 Tax=Pseudoalteromonas sp. MelDa3 TaxID=888435 RepID=UPI000CCA6BD4|nr:hypothetical protein [Pseudoalteromonas sp. MelDa3]PLT23521.1 hypothetical protein CXF89_19295 [Pseudoalteromonas sp. MelDa3]
MASNRLIKIKEQIQAAKKLNKLQAGKKIEAAESILTDAVELVADIEHRLDKVEQILGLCNLDDLVNGGANGY